MQTSIPFFTKHAIVYKIRTMHFVHCTTIYIVRCYNECDMDYKLYTIFHRTDSSGIVSARVVYMNAKKEQMNRQCKVWLRLSRFK